VLLLVVLLVAVPLAP